MKTKIITFIGALCSLPGFAQTHTRTQLLSDLEFLEEAFRNGHPGSDSRYFSVREIAADVSRAPETINDRDYTLYIERAVYAIGCVHTAVVENPLEKKGIVPSYPPLTVEIRGEQLVVTHCANDSLVGRRIRTINDVPALIFTTRYDRYKAGDGGTAAFSREYFRLASPKIIADELNHRPKYRIETDSGTFVLNGQRTFYRPEKFSSPAQVALQNGSSYLYYTDSIPVMRVASFQKSDRAFFRKALASIQTQQAETMILDLRQNTGGNRKAAIALTRLLVDTTFGYSIFEPKDSPRKYLDAKGKRLFFLSGFKYTTETIFRRRSCFPRGKYYHYRFKPAEKPFHGKIIVLTDGFTASSSTMVTSWLKQHGNAVFVGAQAGGGYNGNNGGSFPTLTLPHSQIRLRFPAYRLIFDEQSPQAEGIVPDFPVVPTADDLRLHQDPVLKTALQKAAE